MPDLPIKPFTGCLQLVVFPNRALTSGILLVAAFLLLIGISWVWLPYDPAVLDIAGKLQPPNRHHWLGTDQLGRDVLSMLMLGGQVSLWVALSATGVGLGIGVPLGLMAAARGGWWDEVIMRTNDVIFAFPSLLLAVLVSATLGPGMESAVIAIGVFNIPVFARMTRSSAQSLWSREFILAAIVAGKGKLRISLEHVLPNLLGLLTVQLSLQLSLGIVAEAALSYVGLGAQPPAPSWGRMLSDAQSLTALAPWLPLFPGLAIVGMVMGFNLLGDGVARALAPKHPGELP